MLCFLDPDALTLVALGFLEPALEASSILFTLVLTGVWFPGTLSSFPFLLPSISWPGPSSSFPWSLFLFFLGQEGGFVIHLASVKVVAYTFEAFPGGEDFPAEGVDGFLSGYSSLVLILFCSPPGLPFPGSLLFP